MSKYLKRYNEETGKWELVSAPDVSVVQQLEDGSDITDTNVVITNVNYAGGESGETTLNKTLTVISDDISRLERNVSWLAEHGGGGGTGGPRAEGGVRGASLCAGPAGGHEGRRAAAA